MTPQCQDYLHWHFPMDVRRPHSAGHSNLRDRIKIVQEIHRQAVFWKDTIIEDLWQKKATCPGHPLRNTKPLFLFRDRVCFGIILVVVYKSFYLIERFVTMPTFSSLVTPEVIVPTSCLSLRYRRMSLSRLAGELGNWLCLWCLTSPVTDPSQQL